MVKHIYNLSSINQSNSNVLHKQLYNPFNSKRRSFSRRFRMWVHSEQHMINTVGMKQRDLDNALDGPLRALTAQPFSSSSSFSTPTLKSAEFAAPFSPSSAVALLHPQQQTHSPIP